MKQPLALVGAAPGCSVRLNGADISPFAFSLVLTSKGLWVVDLLPQVGSSRHAPLTVNGEPVRFARLDPGDVLRMGAFTVTADIRPAVVVARPGAPAPTDLPALDRLRRECEARIARQSERHRALISELRQEVEQLRDCVDDLRDRLDEATPGQTPDAPSPRRRTAAPPPRTLGAASKRRRAPDEPRPTLPPSAPPALGSSGTFGSPVGVSSWANPTGAS
jgi:hypothetical protein